MADWDHPTLEAPLVSLATTDELSSPNRYSARSLLGAGGMGEVRLVRDGRIGRDVAMKVMTAGGDAPRFLREARVQGQLEHPAIVPVYDVAKDAAGALHFTMKRVRGVTLAEIVARLASGEATARATYTTRKLLSAFVSICLAIDFAHSRGVLHRDLKPSNLMLGEFGEVYVLDWGIAKLVDDKEPEALHPRVGETQVGARYATQAGLVLGTVGYMAPEQLRGEPFDARADVYALGAILFEMLTLEPLHLGDVAREIAESTLADATPRVRAICGAREIAPELEAVCLGAVAFDPARRTGSVRAVSDAVERYLDGDRDLARRRELAAAHAAAAGLALGELGGLDPEGARKRATREAGRALALDPDCEAAARTLVVLLATPPKALPAEVREQIHADRLDAARSAGRAGALGFCVMLAMVPLVAWMGVRSWPLVGVGCAVIGAGIVLSLASARWPSRASVLFRAILGLMAVLIAVLSTMFGPLLAAPAIAGGIAITAAFHPFAPRRAPVLLMCAGFLVPLALQLAGLAPRSYGTAGGDLVVHPLLVSFPETPTLVYLALSSIGVVVSVSAFVNAIRRSLDEAQRVVRVQAWQLGQLLPDTTRVQPTREK